MMVIEPLSEPMRLGVFASGNGSNMEAIAAAIDDGRLPAQVALCICNRPGAGVIGRADARKIPVVLLDPGTYADERAYVADLVRVLDAHRINFVALAGYLKKVPVDVVARFPGRMLNIHPALLPAFGGKGMYGRHVHEAVLEYGVRWTGVTVHLVDNEYDHGPVVLQEPVPVLPEDTAESLAARIHPVEHRLYPEALRLFATGGVRIEGRRVVIRPSEQTH